MVINKQRNQSEQDYNRSNNNNNRIQWIETAILNHPDPLADYRKTCIWRILAPYLINIRKQAYPEAFDVMKGWLHKCNELKRLDFDPKSKINEEINRVGNYYPIR